MDQFQARKHRRSVRLGRRRPVFSMSELWVEGSEVRETRCLGGWDPEGGETVRQHAKPVGERALAGGAVGGQLGLVFLDQALRLSPLTVGPFIQVVKFERVYGGSQSDFRRLVTCEWTTSQAEAYMHIQDPARRAVPADAEV